MSASAAAAAAQEDWRALSACLAEDPELFFPLSPRGPGGEQIAKAKRVCARCLVQESCLRFAFESGQEFGVWGGLSEDERRALRVRTARPAPRPVPPHQPAPARRRATVGSRG
ncbi:MAG: WhiB family transcriptional regulator [Streptosporangiaceae bacterium]